MRNLLHTEYNKYISNFLKLKSDSTFKSFWNYIKSQKQDSVSKGTLKDNYDIVESTRDMAEMFNSQFFSAFTNEKNEGYAR